MDETEREAVPRANASGTLARLIILTFSGERGARSFSDLFREFVQCYQALSNESPVPLWRPANDRAAAAAMADVLADRMKSGELTPAPLRLAARFVFSTLEGLQWQVRDGTLSREKAAGLMSMMVLDGLASTPADETSDIL